MFKVKANKKKLKLFTFIDENIPKNFVTDMEADRILAAMSPQAVEKLYELAVKYGITKL